MKIILQHEGKKAINPNAPEEEIIASDLEEEFALDDTPFDVPGWISVEVGGVSVAQIHINDLYPAAVALKERYEQQRG